MDFKIKVKTHNKMIEELEAGDKVVTSGGIIGVVIKVDKKNSTFHPEGSPGPCDSLYIFQESFQVLCERP